MALRLRRGTDAERLIMEPPAAGELIYTTDTKAVYVGDGTTVGGLPVSGQALGIDDLGNVTITAPNDNDILKWNGTAWINVPQESLEKPGNIYGTDSTLLIDTDNSVIVGPIVANTPIIGDVVGDITGNLTGDVIGDVVGTLTGNVIGILDGDVTGSVFGDDSTILVDGVNNQIVGEINTDNRVTINGPVSWGETNTDLDIKFDFYSTQHGAFPVSAVNVNNVADTAVSNELTFYKARGTIDAQTIVQAGDSLGGISWAANDSTGGSFGGAIYTVVNSVSEGDVDADILFRTRKGAIFPGAGEAFRVKGDKGVVAQSYVQFGSLTYAERDAITAVAGMVIWNSDSTQFEGYDGTNWINLVDGATSTAP